MNVCHGAIADTFGGCFILYSLKRNEIKLHLLLPATMLTICVFYIIFVGRNERETNECPLNGLWTDHVG